jgi:hypothetical protein
LGQVLDTLLRIRFLKQRFGTKKFTGTKLTEEAMTEKRLPRTRLNPMTREEVMQAIQECRQQLGRTPSQVELQKMTEVRQGHVQKHFGFYTRALNACNLEPCSAGNPLPLEKLFDDWAKVVRQLKKVPSFTEYEQHGIYTRTPLKNRCGRWTLVPTAMKRHIEEHTVKEEWTDVLGIITEYERLHEEFPVAQRSPMDAMRKPKPIEGRTIYGPPTGRCAATHGPTNELGVIYLFGTLADRLGFVVTHIQHAFPDCEAMRKVGDDQWQKVTIEFEFESRNFVRHLHDVNGCDLIVCWKHNWEECPLEVVELRKAVSMQ